MLKQLILLLGLASSLVSAAPEFVQYEGLAPPIKSLTATDAARKGSTSDSSCYVKELGNLAPTFHRPSPDVCVPVAALRKLKIFTTATCSNGTGALLARYDAPACVGEPTILETVTDDMIKICLDMPSREAGSYVFWCDGDIKQPPAKDEPLAPGESGKGGSIWGLIGILLLIFVTFLLIAILKLMSFLTKATNTGNKFLASSTIPAMLEPGRLTGLQSIFGQRDGAIAL